MSASELKVKTIDQELPSNINELLHQLEIKCKRIRVCAAIEDRRVRGSVQTACPYLRHIWPLFESSATVIFMSSIYVALVKSES